MKHNKRFGELDALRGLAALSVVLFHYTTYYTVNYASQNYVSLLGFKYGGYGVELFFILSGFVIYMTIVRSASVREFTLKRAIRLYPAYLISVLITFSITSLFYLQELKVSMQDFMINLTLLQNIIPGYYVKNVDGAYWSLAVEITFYIICAILLFAGAIKKPLALCITWISSLFLIKLLYSKGFFFPLLLIIGDMEIVRFSHLFLAGIAFYQMMNIGLRSKGVLYYHLIIAATLVYNLKFNEMASSVFIVIFYVVFYLFITNKLKFLDIRILTYLGTISYSLYLIHQYIGYIIIKILEDMGYTHQIFIIIPFAFSLLLASIITFYIEKPIQKWSLIKLKERKEGKLASEPIPIKTMAKQGKI